MKCIRLVGSVVVAAVLFVWGAPARAEVYGNFSTLGVVVDPPKGYDTKQIGQVKAFLVEPTGRRQVHDFLEVAGAVEPKGYYATSLFDLQPDTRYTIAVEFCDQRGKVVATQSEVGRTRPEPRLPITARASYVSPQGDDRNPGTLERPFRTLRAALAALRPGTTLFLREGTYYEADLALPRGGSAQSPIVIRSYPGEHPVIDGSAPELLTAGWTVDADGLYVASFPTMTWNVSLEEKATGKHLRCYPVRTREELVTQTSDGRSFAALGFTGAYHWEAGRLSLRLPQGAIGDYLVHVGRFSDSEGRFANALYAEGGRHIALDGITFRHLSGNAVGLRDSSDVLIQNCRIEYCNAGIWVKGDSSNDTVQGCVYTDDTDHWDFEYAKSPRGWSYHGQVETGLVCVDARYSGRGLVIRRNHISHVFDGSHLCPWRQIGARTSETDFYENTIEWLADDFLETDGYSRNVRIFRNTMRGSLSGISLAQALDGPTWVVYNVLADCGVCKGTEGGQNWGYPIKTNGGDYNDNVGTGHVLMYHNTAYTRDPASNAFLVKYAIWRGIRFRNNIWCGKALGVRTMEPQLWPVDWDYDDIYHESGPFAEIAGKVYQTLDDFRQGRIIALLPEFGPKGLGSHLFSEDPKLEDPEHGDYRLRPDSPCVDAGEIIPGINDRNYRGAGPDLGALEH